MGQSALTGSHVGSTAINPYIVKDKGTVTPTDVFSGALIGTALGGCTTPLHFFRCWLQKTD